MIVSIILFTIFGPYFFFNMITTKEFPLILEWIIGTIGIMTFTSIGIVLTFTIKSIYVWLIDKGGLFDDDINDYFDRGSKKIEKRIKKWINEKKL